MGTSRQIWLQGLAWGAIGIVLAATVGHFEMMTSERLGEIRQLGQHVDRLQQALLDCETGLRAYLVTSDRKFLEPQLGREAVAEQRIVKIQDLGKATAPHLDHDGLSRSVQSVLNDIRQAVVAIDEGRRDAVVALPEMELSKRLMDDARHSIGAYQDELDLVTEASYLRQQQLHALEMGLLLVLLTTAGVLHVSARNSTKELAGRLALEREIWRNSGDALFLTDIETNKIVDANPKAGELLGLPSEQIIGREWMEFVAKSSLQQSKDHVAKIGDQAQTPIHGLLLGADGREIPAEATISAVIAMKGNRLAVSAFRPLGAREQALQETAFRKAIEQTLPSGLAAVSDEGVQTYVNDRFCEMVGWSKDELVGKRPPFAYWPPEEADHIQAVFRDATAGLIGRSGAEITLMRASGERFPAQLFVSRIESASSPGWLAFVIDNSDRKRTEAALEEARRLEGIGQLAGQVAHDFNNLLTVITLNTAIARMLPGIPADLAVPLAAMAEAAKRGTSITRTLLALAREQSLHPTPVELVQQINELKPLCVTTCGPAIEIVVDLPVDPVWVSADAGGLAGSLLNLVSNSRDAMPSGGSLSLRLTTRTLEASALTTGSLLKPGPYAVIEVADTGHGMPPDVRRRAFDPFFSTKGRIGTGLGLTSVYGFVRQSGGTAEIESEPGRGTKVRLYIPVIPAPDRIASHPPATTPPASCRVLVVDDESDILQSLSRLLEAAGHSVVVAADGETALMKLDTEHVDILLTDILMPGMGGVALAKRVAQSHPNVSIALMTGFGMRPPDETLPWPVAEKPFGPDVIAALFARLRPNPKS